MDEINFSLGQRFGEERQRLGKTQEELAVLCGVNRRTIGDVERGARPPGGDLALELTKLGFDIQYIFTGVRSVNLYLLAAEEKPDYDAGMIGFAAAMPARKKTIDQAVLAGVIAGVDEYLAEQKLTMPADKKAELVMLLCDLFNAESVKDAPQVKATTAKIIELGRRRR